MGSQAPRKKDLSLRSLPEVLAVTCQAIRSPPMPGCSLDGIEGPKVNESFSSLTCLYFALA